MNDLGSENLHPADALGFGVGADVAGPRLSADREIRLRLGARTETLPFRANGAIVREKGFSGGVGVPFGGERAALDVALERELRSAAVQGVSEGAWTLSVGLTLRP